MYKLSLGSLFDGIGGFPHSAQKYGITPIWASEIEQWPIKVTKKHFPNMKHLGDITQINGAEIEPVDIITFGSPCQDLSVAGKREGLAGERSGLFMDAIRIIRQMRTATGGKCPRFAVWENVPGAFSSNKGEDIKTVLDELEGLGFVIDMNVLDAQFMGVPQRRRRIFALCTSANFIRQMTTHTYWSIITQLLTEILLCILSEQLNLYEKEPKDSVWKQRKLTADGLQRKMKLFSIEAREGFEILLNNWIGICRIHLKEQFCLRSRLGKSDTITKADTNKNECQMVMELEKLFGDILRSWKELLDELYYQENSCITLIATKETTNQIIYGCANLLENMALLIGQLKNYYQNLYETELYISTARKVCINYARERQTGITLFSGMERVQCWDDYIRLHTETTEQLERHFGGQCASEILFIEEGLSGNFAESGEARQEAAGDTRDGVDKSSIFDPYNNAVSEKCTSLGSNCGMSTGRSIVLADQGGSVMSVHNDISPTLRAQEHGHQPIVMREVSRTLRAEAGAPKHEADWESLIIEPRSQDGVCRIHDDGIVPTLNTAQGGQRQPCVCIQNATRGKSQNGLGVSQDDVSYTLDSLGNHAVCIQGSMIGRADKNGPQGDGINEEVSFTLNTTDRHAVAYGESSFGQYAEGVATLKASGGVLGGGSETFIEQEYAVRRLVPTEALRLQGFPDYWLDIEEMSDTQKYKAIGNSVAIPCVDFIMQGLSRVLDINSLE